MEDLMTDTLKSRDSLAAAVEDYLDWHALRGSTLKHRKELQRMLGLFCEHAGGERRVEEIRGEDCTSFLRPFQDKGRKPNTLRAYYRTLGALFAWLVEEERLGVTPMKRVPAPKALQEPIQPLTAEELVRLLRQPDPRYFTGRRDRAFIALLADSGLRVSEALSITMRQVDMKGRSISVQGKGSKPRTVFFGQAAARLIKETLQDREGIGPEDLLFISSLGERLCRYTMTNRLHKYGEAAEIRGKRVSPHTLRHSFAVAWLMGGGDALSLQRLLGHSTPAMTSRYVNFTSGDLAKRHREVSPLDRMQGTMPEVRPAPAPGKKRLR
jgi:integrase/recombinase XerD